MIDSSPTEAAIVASEEAAFPVEAHVIRPTPRSSARATAIADARSLSEALGFRPSSFTWTAERPSEAARRGNGTSGVSPMRSEIAGTEPTGRKGSQRQIPLPHARAVRSRDQRAFTES